jgi:hypothetical protein
MSQSDERPLENVSGKLLPDHTAGKGYLENAVVDVVECQSEGLGLALDQFTELGDPRILVLRGSVLFAGANGDHFTQKIDHLVTVVQTSVKPQQAIDIDEVIALQGFILTVAVDGTF